MKIRQVVLLHGMLIDVQLTIVGVCGLDFVGEPMGFVRTYILPW